jgi:hypothetical protein
MKKQLLSFIVASLTAASVLTPFVASLAAPTFSFDSTGAAILNIGDFTVATYASGLEISNIGSAARSGVTFTFPVVGGAVDADTIDLESISLGGLKFTNGTDVVVLDLPIVNTAAAQPIMTFLVTVNGTIEGRYAMFNLKVPNYAKPQSLKPGEKVHAANILVTLSQDGATLFNMTLKTTFTSGLSVGTLKVKSALAAKLPG